MKKIAIPARAIALGHGKEETDSPSSTAQKLKICPRQCLRTREPEFQAAGAAPLRSLLAEGEREDGSTAARARDRAWRSPSDGKQGKTQTTLLSMLNETPDFPFPLHASPLLSAPFTGFRRRGQGQKCDE